MLDLNYYVKNSFNVYIDKKSYVIFIKINNMKRRSNIDQSVERLLTPRNIFRIASKRVVVRKAFIFIILFNF